MLREESSEVGAGYKAANRRTTHNGNAPRISSRHWRGQNSHTYYQKKLAAISIQLYPSPGVTDVQVVHNERCYGFERCRAMDSGNTTVMFQKLKRHPTGNDPDMKRRTFDGFYMYSLRTSGPLHPKYKLIFYRRLVFNLRISKLHSGI